MTALDWVPRFIYGTGGDEVDWTLSLPTEPWTRQTRTTGGSRISGGGVPAAYVVRRDYDLVVPLRLFEREMADLDGLVTWGQTAESFLFIPDASSPSDRYTVYLDDPVAGEDWEPARDPDYLDALLFPLTLRRTTGGVWTLRYLGDC